MREIRRRGRAGRHGRRAVAAGIYVDDANHTNTIEGFFENMKIGMRGETGMRRAYRKVSRRRLQSYVDEYAWRYNRRG